MKKIIIILVLTGFLSPSFSFAQWEKPPLTMPETTEQAKELGEKALEVTKTALPGIIKQIWQEEALPVLLKMWNWCKKTFWDPYLGPFFQKEIEKRKPIIKEEFEKEKQETKESAKTEVIPTLKSLWEKFKELIK